MNENENDSRTAVVRISRAWLVALVAMSVLFLLAEVSYEKHPHVKYETWFGFFGIASLGGMLSLSLVSTLVRGVLKRNRGYYDV